MFRRWICTRRLLCRNSFGRSSSLFGTTIRIVLFFSAVRWSLVPEPKETLFLFRGAAILFGFFFLPLGWTGGYDSPLWGFMPGTAILFGFSIWDDLFDLSGGRRFSFRSYSPALVHFRGADSLCDESFWRSGHSSRIVTLPVFVIGLGWLLLVMNALNWLDGSDGLLGGVSFIALITIFFLTMKPDVNQPAFAIIAVKRGRSHWLFFLFNLPPARILLEQADRMFLGFLLVFSTAAEQDCHGAFWFSCSR